MSNFLQIRYLFVAGILHLSIRISNDLQGPIGFTHQDGPEEVPGVECCQGHQQQVEAVEHVLPVDCNFIIKEMMIPAAKGSRSGLFKPAIAAGSKAGKGKFSLIFYLFS